METGNLHDKEGAATLPPCTSCFQTVMWREIIYLM